jgi:hypothetical protein
MNVGTSGQPPPESALIKRSVRHTTHYPIHPLRPSSPQQPQGLGATTVSLSLSPRPSSSPPPHPSIFRQLSIALKDDRRLRVPIFRTQPSESAVIAKDALGHRLLLQEAATKSHCSDNVLPPSSNGSLPGLARLPNILLLCSSSGCIAARLAVL